MSEQVISDTVHVFVDLKCKQLFSVTVIQDQEDVQYGCQGMFYNSSIL